MYPNYGYHVYLTSGLDDDGDGVLSSMEDSWWVNSTLVGMCLPLYMCET